MPDAQETSADLRPVAAARAVGAEVVVVAMPRWAQTLEQDARVVLSVIDALERRCASCRGGRGLVVAARAARQRPIDGGDLTTTSARCLTAFTVASRDETLRPIVIVC